MKWPKYIAAVRHDTSEYNVLRVLKARDRQYQAFLQAYGANPTSAETRQLAEALHNRYPLRVADCRTQLVDREAKLAVHTGKGLSQHLEVPDIIFRSPYERAEHTLEGIIKGWPALKLVKCIEDERLRELEHGLALLFNDWRIFFTFHPEQRLLYEQEDAYWYRYPQGENVPDVRERIRSWLNTITRDFAGKKVFVVSHHLTILSLRANLERLNEAGFIHLDDNDKPKNCGVTLYTGRPDQGSDGRLELTYYNRSFA